MCNQAEEKEREKEEGEGKRATVHSLVRISIGVSIEAFVKFFVILLHDVKHVSRRKSFQGRF